MGETIHWDSVLQRVDDLISCDLDGEVALMSVANGKYYGLNAMGSRIWALLAEARPVGEVCGLLQGEFQVELGQCRDEVLAFVRELAQEQLIRVADEPSR